MDERYLTYKRALAQESLPALFLDVDQLRKNASHLARMAGALPIRIASKSVRCRAALKYVLDHFPQFRGVMAYSVAEASFLASHGFSDILLGYPSLERAQIWDAVSRSQVHAITFMASEVEHVQLLEEAARAHKTILNICIDVDHSLVLPGLHFGVRRSRLHGVEDTLLLARIIQASAHLKLRGLMGYEAQVAGVPDRQKNPLRGLIIRALKRRSVNHIVRLRRELKQALDGSGMTVELFNGGGTGSLHIGRDDPSLTELTAGSGLFAPTLFDGYHALQLAPALAFALRVTRRPSGNWVTCNGGGLIASGAAGREKLPAPWLPAGLSLSALEGAGEVQTPLTGPVPDLQLGDPVFFRHAKAGEVCEHFRDICVIKNGTLIEKWPTYRGEGQRF